MAIMALELGEAVPSCVVRTFCLSTPTTSCPSIDATPNSYTQHISADLTRTYQFHVQLAALTRSLIPRNTSCRLISRLQVREKQLSQQPLDSSGRMNNNDDLIHSMATSQPIILPPATPSELFQHVLSKSTYPTTVVIGWPRDQFISALVEDVKQQSAEQQQQQQQDKTAAHGHTLLQATLLQTATSRHINVVFTPTVAHLRAHLATFLASESKVPPPPGQENGKTPPSLMVYGHLELHRDGQDWSAQGLGVSTAMLVDGALRNEFRAVIVEPRRTADDGELARLLSESVPVLKSTPLRDDGSWSGPTVAVSRVLGRWFKIDNTGVA